jgi:glycosyltransferase involved in cell wall biosynthesis
MGANGFKPPIEIIPYFHPTAEVTDSAAESPAAADFLLTQRPYFAFVGRLEKIKGVQVLIDTFKGYNHADLVIAGRGNYESTLRKLAAGMPNVHFAGFLNQAQLKTLYRRAIACLVPSLCYETFGLVTLESFAAKTPVIVHDLGALPEMIADGGGLKYQTREELITAMETLRTQPDLRNEMGARAHEITLSRYTEDKHLARYLEFIERAKTK